MLVVVSADALQVSQLMLDTPAHEGDQRWLSEGRPGSYVADANAQSNAGGAARQHLPSAWALRPEPSAGRSRAPMWTASAPAARRPPPSSAAPSTCPRFAR